VRRRLSYPDRYGYADSDGYGDTDGFSYRYGNSYTYRNCHGYAHSDIYSQADADTEVSADAKAAPDAGASTVIAQCLRRQHSQNIGRQAGAFGLRGTAPGGRFGIPDWRIARRFHFNRSMLQPRNEITYRFSP
jgi:hypothetical protein